MVRKLYGYTHIPQQYAEEFAQFNSQQVYRYINFHRPCYFPTTITDNKGRQRKQYRYQDMMTPYEKLKSLPDANTYLKDGQSFELLDKIELNISDDEAADLLQSERNKLFKLISSDNK